MIKLSIIIPIYNEENTVREILRRVLSVKLQPEVNREIIVVDDGSTDDTKSKIKNQKSKIIKTFFHEKNLGKGAAVRTGIMHATGDLIIIQDADLEYNPKYFIKLLDPILQNNAQVVYGSRLIDYPLKFWGKDKAVLPLHLIANRFLTFLTNLIYGGKLTDMETGYKLFKSEILKNITIDSNQFDFEAEVTAKILKLKISITEVPIKVKPRTYAEGKKIGWTDGVSAIWTLLKYKFTN